MIRLRKNVLFVILFSVLALFFISCEGPVGSDGIDGIDGTDGTDGLAGADGADGNVTCLQCHATDKFEQARYDFAASQHSSGSVAVAYAGGNVAWGDCTRCHSSEGFIAFANGFEPQHITNPSPWVCGTCHSLHNEFTSEDYNLRMTTAASIWNDGTFLLKGQDLMELEGGNALCANCHQSRRAEPNIDVPGATFEITSTHYGPHHGPQANVLTGTGFAEFDGTISYPDPNSATHMTPGCTGCHMANNSHTFEPTLTGCTDCHTGLASFDLNGSQTDIHDLLVELRDLLLAAGVLTGDDTDGYHPVVGTYDMVLARAFFNWVGLEEDRSLGVHNPSYVNALLKNSIEAVEAL